MPDPKKKTPAKKKTKKPLLPINPFFPLGKATNALKKVNKLTGKAKK